MHKQKRNDFFSRYATKCATILLLGLAAATQTPQVFGQDSLPALGEGSSPWNVDVFYENATYFRGKDNTGNTVGLSKFRNTLQAEADKDLSDGWASTVSSVAPMMAYIS